MKVRTFTNRLIQLNKYVLFYCGQMATALSDDEGKEILYHVMSNLWRRKMTEQGYNYLDRSIKEIKDFFETRVENLDTQSPSLAVRSLSRKKKNSKKQKAFFFCGL